MSKDLPDETAKELLPTRRENGFVVYDIPTEGPKVTTEHVKELEAESDLDNLT